MRKTIKFDAEDLPEWLQDVLYQNNPEPNHNTLFKLLIDDYIKRNAPCPHEFEKPRSFWDPSKGGEVQANGEYCRKCGIKAAQKEMTPEEIREHNRKGLADIKAKAIF